MDMNVILIVQSMRKIHSLHPFAAAYGLRSRNRRKLSSVRWVSRTTTFGCGHGLSEHNASTKTRTAFGSFISKFANMLDVAIFHLASRSRA